MTVGFAPPARAELLAGAAREVITPENPQWIAGYSRNRLQATVHDNLYAHCLYLSDGEGGEALIVSLDLIGFMYRDVLAARQKLHESGYEGANILIASTHTHSGPDTIGLWGASEAESGRDDNFISFVQDRIAACGMAAKDRAAPALMGVGEANIGGVCHNVRDPEIQDNAATALQFRTTDGLAIATLVNYGCHPEAMDTNAISADFVSIYYDRVREKTGGEAMFLNGALGGMVVPAIKEYSWPEAERVGKLFAGQIEELLGRLEWLRPGPIEFQSKSLFIPFEGEKFRKAAELLWPGEADVANVPTEIDRMVVGPVEILSLPGEPLPKFGLRIKSLMTARYKILAALGDDELGYIVPAEDFDPKRYEEQTSAGSKIAPILFEAAKEIANAKLLAQ